MINWVIYFNFNYLINLKEKVFLVILFFLVNLQLLYYFLCSYQLFKDLSKYSILYLLVSLIILLFLILSILILIHHQICYFFIVLVFENLLKKLHYFIKRISFFHSQELLKLYFCYD